MSNRVPVVMLALAAVLLAATCAAEEVAFDKARFNAHVEALCAMPHRLTGTKEGAQAREYIEAQLKSMGLNVLRQPFTVPQCISRDCRIVINGKEHALLPMRPNVLQASITPPEGLTGGELSSGFA